MKSPVRQTLALACATAFVSTLTACAGTPAAADNVGAAPVAATSPSQAAQQALRKELDLALQSRGAPGTDLAFNDGPER